LHAGVPHVLAQDELAQDASEVEVITEPPPQLESPPPEPPAEQPPPEPEKLEEPLGHLRVGGGIRFGFGSNFISIGISPQVSYIFKRIVEPGVALRYEYSSFESFRSSSSSSSSRARSSIRGGSKPASAPAAETTATCFSGAASS